VDGVMKERLAFKHATFDVGAFCMAARRIAAFIMSGAFFIDQGIVKVLYTPVKRGEIIDGGKARSLKRLNPE